MNWKLNRDTLAPWVATILLFGSWEAMVWVTGVDESVLPAPSAVINALFEFWGPIWMHTQQTLYTTLVGFAIAIVFGMGLGLVTGASPLLYRAIYPLLIGFNAIPKVAIVPVLVIWFSSGTIPAIITAFLISFFPIAVNVATGIATLEPELQDVLRSLGARKSDILFKVGVPRSLPYFFASLKISITLAFVGSVISETVASNAGIGYLMLQAYSSFRVPLMFAGLLAIAVIAIIMYGIAVWIEQRLTGWSVRGTENTTFTGGG